MGSQKLGHLEEILERGGRETIDKAVEEALRTKENSIAERTKVGVSLATYDKRVFGGCNLENYAKKTVHAEEVALFKALSEGYRGTDFWFMVQIYQSGIHEEEEVYPACGHCVGWLWEYTHPDLIILNVTPEKDVVHASKLKEILHYDPPAQAYPSPEIKRKKTALTECMRPKLKDSPYYDRYYDGDGNPKF